MRVAILSQTDDTRRTRAVTDTSFDSTSHKEFYDYYRQQSESAETRNRFLGIRNIALMLIRRKMGMAVDLDIADIGCGAGTQSLLWAEMGYRVHGVDINAPLVALAKERARAANFDIDYRVGLASALPWPDKSMDVCLVPELLEHVVSWRECLDEFARILLPGGILIVTTNNTLCPVQHEFNLPLYSWYPSRLKRYCEKLAVTTKPSLANYAKYPAVNWFTYYSLSREIEKRGFHALDRFDVMNQEKMTISRRVAVNMIQIASVFRFFANVVTPYTLILAVKAEA